MHHSTHPPPRPQACNDHDNCYATLGSDRPQCDQAFLDAMKAECQSSVG